MKKQKLIEDIKNVREFKKQLEDIAIQIYFDCNFTFGLGTAVRFARLIIDYVYNPIRKKYCKEKDKLYRKQLDWYECYCKRLRDAIVQKEANKNLLAQPNDEVEV